MRVIKRWHPSPATVIASIALLVALGGTSYAAVSIVLPPGSVGTVQIKPNAVTSAKVKDGTLLNTDFKPGQIPAGPSGAPGAPGPPGATGATGAAGAAGAAGPGAKWALVLSDGGLAAQSGGISVIHPFTGGYYVNFGSSVSGKAVAVTNAYRDTDGGVRGAPLTTLCGSGGEGSGCSVSNNTSTVYVGTFSAGGVAENHAFYIAVF